MNEKPEALRLADILQGQADRDYAFIDDFRYGSAAELRRLHAENERLRELLTEAKDLAWAFGADSLRDRINAALRRENERLNAIALQAQNAAIDLAKQNERMTAPRPEPTTVPKSVPLPRITCGFVDVRFDGDGWFCTKCGERMPANYEAMVKHYSGDRDHLELMQRKAEALRREET